MHNRSGRSQNVSPPSTVPGAEIRPMVGIPCAVVQRSISSSSPLPVGLAGAERDRPGVRHEQRIELVDEVRARGLGIEDVDGGAEAGEQFGERVVLALGERQVHGVEEAVGRIVERPPEGRSRPLDEDLAQRRGHALRPERAASHGFDHRLCPGAGEPGRRARRDDPESLDEAGPPRPPCCSARVPGGGRRRSRRDRVAR